MSDNPYMDLGVQVGRTLVLVATRAGKTRLLSLVLDHEQIGKAGLGGEDPHRSPGDDKPSPERKYSS